MRVPVLRRAQHIREIQTRRRAEWIVQHHRTARHHRLTFVRLRELSAALRKKGRQMRHDALVHVQRQIQQLRGRFTREVIIRRPQPTGDQHHIRALRRLRDRRADHRAIRHDRLPRHLDAQRSQALADPCRVRVHRVSEEQFCACVDEFDSHVARRHNQEARAVSEMMRYIAKTPSTHGFGSYGR